MANKRQILNTKLNNGKVYTYKFPHMQTNWKTKIDQDKKNSCFKFRDQNVDQTSLKYVCVEE